MGDISAIQHELETRNARTHRDVEELSMTEAQRDAKVAKMLAAKKAKAESQAAAEKANAESQARAAAQLRGGGAASKLKRASSNGLVE